MGIYFSKLHTSWEECSESLIQPCDYAFEWEESILVLWRNEECSTSDHGIPIGNVIAALLSNHKLRLWASLVVLKQQPPAQGDFFFISPSKSTRWEKANEGDRL